MERMDNPDEDEDDDEDDEDDAVSGVQDLRGIRIESRRSDPGEEGAYDSILDGVIVVSEGSLGNEDEDADADEEEAAMGNFQFLTSGLMSKKSVEVSDIRADAEAAMKEFESVVGLGSST